MSWFNGRCRAAKAYQNRGNESILQLKLVENSPNFCEYHEYRTALPPRIGIAIIHSGELATQWANVVVLEYRATAFGTCYGIGRFFIFVVLLIRFNTPYPSVDDGCGDDWCQRHNNGNAGSRLNGIACHDETNAPGEHDQHTKWCCVVELPPRSIGGTPFDQLGTGDEVGRTYETSATPSAMCTEDEVGVSALRTDNEIGAVVF